MIINFCLKFFEWIFLASLVSAQKLSVLFPLRNFRFVANLVFKCLVSLPKMNFYRDLRKFDF